jgi:prepilin-type N-terminal cleavage/methylation domain-containing protein
MSKESIPWRPGLVLVEMLVVLSIIAFLTSIAMLSFSAVSGKMHFQRKADNLVAILQTAWNTAQQSDRRYVVELSFKEQFWVLRELVPVETETVSPEDTAIKSGFFDNRFQLDYVLYDDGLDTRVPREGEITTVASLVAGHGGWQYGGKVVLRDEDGNPWSIVFYRIGKPVELMPGDVDILLALEAKYMRF